ncbi:MAG: DEAD/DEAH box helicase [Candidatus Altimarinota bacterium]
MTDITFESLGLSKEILKSIEEKGYKNPSPIQAGVIPLALNTDKDIVGQAQTGSGKTAAFGLPILDRIDKNSRDLQALILTPTRELAIQVAEELKSFSTNSNVNIVLLYGGQPIRSEMSTLRTGPQIIVGTPGRVTDHLQKGRVNLDTIKYFVLDEADEMLNVGFREEIEEILKFSPVNKKVFLFSATMPPFIAGIVKNYMRDYETISIKKEELTNSNIKQVHYDAPRGHKFDVLCRILDITPDFYGIIFCRTKAETDEVASKLSQKGYLAEAIHGDIEQAMREKVLGRFKKRAVSILVATDVAARGIDVNDLSHVVNFELPDNPESYTHRIGRTGRAGKNGTAISIVSSSDSRKLFFIERTIKAKITKEKLPNGEEVVEHKKKGLLHDVETLIITDEARDYLAISGELLEGKEPALVISTLLKKFYKDEFKADSYKDFSVRERSSDRGERFERGERSERSFASRDDGMIRLFVAKGKMDNIQNPGALLSFIAKESNLGDLGAGKVDILTNFSYVDLPEDVGHVVLQAFKDKNPVKPLIVRAKEKTDGGERRSYSGGGDRRRDDRRSSGGYRNSDRSGYRGGRSDDRRSSGGRDFKKPRY